jgi:hypothetical protein
VDDPTIRRGDEVRARNLGGANLAVRVQRRIGPELQPRQQREHRALRQLRRRPDSGRIGRLRRLNPQPKA